MALTQQQVNQYDVSTGFGMRKVEELQALGATREQIIEIAARAPIIGDRAAALFPELASWGSKEKVDLGVIPGNFNWIKYVNANPDLDDAGIDTAEEAARHYALFGSKEGRPDAPAPLPSRDERYQTLRTELENQYKALVKLAPAAAYAGRSSDLNAIFNQQAAQLADAGVQHVGDLQIQNGRLVNKTTGKEVTTSNLGGQVAVDRDTGVLKWGDIFSGVKGGSNYGLQELPDGSILFFPAWEKTKSPISQVGLGFLEPIIAPIATIAGTIIGGPVGAGVGNSIGQFLATGEVELEQALIAAGTAYVATEASAATGGSAQDIGAAVAPSASAATQAAIGEAAINAGIGAGISVAAGGDPLQGAIMGAAGSITSTTYAQAVGKSIAPTASVAAQVTIGNAVLNSALSGVMASATGGDVSKSMLAGAAKGATIANTKTVAETLVGKENIAAIVNSTNLTTAQVENIIATSVGNGIVAEVTESGSFADAMARTLVANGVGTSTANAVVNSVNLDLEEEKAIFAATRNLASVATDAALRGENVEEALGRAAPGAILSGYQSYEQELDRQDAAKEQQIGAVQQPIQVASSQPIQISGVLPVIYQTANYSVNSAGIIFDNQGYVIGELNEYELFDLRKQLGLSVDVSPTMIEGARTDFGAAIGGIGEGINPSSFDQTVAERTGVDATLPSTVIQGPGTTPGVPKGVEGGVISEPIVIQPRISESFRPIATQSLIQNELARLENELATLNAQQLTSQQALGRAQGQFERISELPTGTIDADLRGDLEAELADLEDTLSQSAERAEQLERERGAVEGIGADDGQRLTDEQLLGYLETGELPEGFFGRPESEGTAPEGGLAEGGEGEGEGLGGTGEGGEGEGGEGEGEGGALEPDAIRTPLSPALIFSQSLPQRPETTPFASRVTGQALEGILGEKEPLFGGDEDEQRAVWNRRSLRLLSRALGL